MPKQRVAHNPKGPKLKKALKESIALSKKRATTLELEDRATFETHGGATSSILRSVRYDLVPQALLRRTAERFAEGIAKGHAEYNYRGGNEAFVRSRYNHFVRHLMLFLDGKDRGFDPREDDNLGAVAWCISFFCELQETKAGREKLLEALQTMNPRLKERLDENS